LISVIFCEPHTSLPITSHLLGPHTLPSTVPKYPQVEWRHQVSHPYKTAFIQNLAIKLHSSNCFNTVNK
jgi:hypothetical protein